jgi:hypothetical protein
MPSLMRFSCDILVVFFLDSAKSPLIRWVAASGSCTAYPMFVIKREYHSLFSTEVHTEAVNDGWPPCKLKELPIG